MVNSVSERGTGEGSRVVMANSAKKKNGDIFQKIFRCYKAVEIAVRKKKLFNIGPGYFPAKQVHWFGGVSSMLVHRALDNKFYSSPCSGWLKWI